MERITTKKIEEQIETLSTLLDYSLNETDAKKNGESVFMTYDYNYLGFKLILVDVNGHGHGNVPYIDNRVKSKKAFSEYLSAVINGIYATNAMTAMNNR